jgi:hypothetical protein
MKAIAILSVLVTLVSGTPFFAGKTVLALFVTQQAEGILQGVVSDPEGKPLSGMKVVMHNSSIKREINTGSGGRYELRVPEGLYEVSAGTECNQSMYYRKDVKVTAGEVTSLEIRLNLIYSVAGRNVSIYHLIANPEKYHNRLVTVEGFLHVKPEDSAIYASKDDADYLIGMNALWVQYSSEELKIETSKPSLKLSPASLEYFDGRYVAIQGVFDMKSCGHMAAFAGEIKSVTSLRELKRIYDGKKELR